ncbi:MAG: hypothetical protein ACK55E_08190 [Cyanobacteriota bacterium]|jgi:hypothetical protein
MVPPSPARGEDHPQNRTGSLGSTEHLLALALQNGAIGMYSPIRLMAASWW